MVIKQVIVMRRDLKCRRGKEISQSCHSSIAFLTRKIQRYLEDYKDWQGESHDRPDFETYLSKTELDWINGIFAKICVTVNSEEELLEIEKKANEAGIECHLITDRGLTEFNGVPTRTCLALGPDDSDKIDLLTGSLKLY